VFGLLHRLANSVRSKLVGINNGSTEVDLIPDVRTYKSAMRNPFARQRLIECSLIEEEENSYYKSLLDTVAAHCLGTMPRVRLSLPNPSAEDQIEDQWIAWGANNGIGTALRQLRRDACQTGIGIAIPYTKENSLDPVKLAFRNVSCLLLATPPGKGLNDRIIGGIEYDKNWDPVRIYLKEDTSLQPTPYNVKDILFWYKKTPYMQTPECGPAFMLYPSVKRYLNAVVRGEELRQSIAMAIEQDPTIYIPISSTPLKSKFEYEPGMIPALPPGTKLTGISSSQSSNDRVAMLKMMVGAAARCVNMPANIALGDSSGHNMATAQVDIQPWKIIVENDRFDFQPVLVKAFWMWYEEAKLVMGYFNSYSKGLKTGYTPLSWSYNVLFHHPDPGKMANARATDLASGATTLSLLYDSMDLKARRELEKEAKMLGIPVLDLYKILLESRTKVQLYQQEPDDDEAPQRTANAA